MTIYKEYVVSLRGLRNLPVAEQLKDISCIVMQRQGVVARFEGLTTHVLGSGSGAYTFFQCEGSKGKLLHLLEVLEGHDKMSVKFHNIIEDIDLAREPVAMTCEGQGELFQRRLSITYPWVGGVFKTWHLTDPLETSIDSTNPDKYYVRYFEESLIQLLEDF